MKRVKPGVKLAELSSQMVFASDIVDDCYRAAGVSECWITSANDSTHGSGSLHYAGKALDFRLHNVAPEKRAVLVNNIKSFLGDEFDVVWEAAGTQNEHIHLEYDP